MHNTSSVKLREYHIYVYKERIFKLMSFSKRANGSMCEFKLSCYYLVFPWQHSVHSSIAIWHTVGSSKKANEEVLDHLNPELIIIIKQCTITRTINVYFLFCFHFIYMYFLHFIRIAQRQPTTKAQHSVNVLITEKPFNGVYKMQWKKGFTVIQGHSLLYYVHLIWAELKHTLSSIPFFHFLRNMQTFLSF